MAMLLGLLISWATPEMSTPSEIILSAWTNCCCWSLVSSSARLRSVMSRMIQMEFHLSLIRASESESSMGSSEPSLRLVISSMVSRMGPSLTGFSATASRWPDSERRGEIRVWIGLPRASAAEKPKVSAAASFQ